MALQWGLTSQPDNVGGIKCLIYANAGEGKTSLAPTCPSPLIISAESGLLSLRKANIERMYGVSTPGISYDINVLNVSSPDSIDEAYEWCRGNAELSGFKTIYLDSITEIGEIVLAATKKSNSNMLQAYGKMNDYMIDIMKKFRDLPRLNVVMTSKQGAIKDVSGTGTKLGPAMPGQTVANEMPYLFDEVFRLATGRDDKNVPYRFLQTVPDLQYHAKDRSGALLPVEFPNFTYLFDKILAA